ncbi:centrosomal protein of 83 kDa-like isoform X2 [Salvia splendens]|uniref:centrosomal protein of 83 kDa-like isoform X2 n=1 Tax=Salvia splendens TaxID=180675 RepID=UPI001C270EFB|nr:centrosomal protein of 83 kDa-like isoform X2 [Salvia splendens]
MIREKIFRLHRHKSSTSYSSATTDASAQKFDFTFSKIQATQVPKGWDKIYVSLISLESGKTVRKSVKANVKNGSCHWTETFAESIWISDIDLEECLFKFLVATRSSKSSILGEVELNLAAFLSSESPVLVTLPLKKCSYGTALQVEVKCLTPKTNPREEKWRAMNAAKDENLDHESVGNQSEASDSFNKNNFNKETRYSFDSMDDSVGRQSSYSSHGFGRQDSVDSNESWSHSSVRSVRSLQRNQREEFRRSCHAAATLLQPNLSLKEGVAFVDGDDDDGNDSNARELEAEARMWEQNARKLSLDLERLRDELSDQSVCVTRLNMELASSRLECQELTQEIENTKALFEEERHTFLGQKELEEELRFQREENENLFSQLNKTRESNIELIGILQEMEETIEKQKLEIESLSVSANKSSSVYLNESKNSNGSDLDEENSCISEMQGALQYEVLILENALQERNIEVEIEEGVWRRVVKEFVVDCTHVLAQKEDKIMSLEGRMNVSKISNEDSCGFEEKSEILQEEIADLDDGVSESLDEMDQTELMKLLSDLQGENIYLLQRVGGLEAQLRYLTDMSETRRVELQLSEGQRVNLENHVKRLGEEIESEKALMREKLSEMERKWLEAEEGRVELDQVNVTLQATAERLMEECNCVHKFNGELREQKRELQSRCLALETKARTLQELKEDVEDLDYESKVKSIIDKLDSRLEVSEGERLRLAEENSLLHMRLEKASEVEKEVLGLRVSGQEMRLRSQKLEASLRSVSRDHQEMECANAFMAEEIRSLKRAVWNKEDCRIRKGALEEKILRLEGDLIARDAVCVQDAEMRNELNLIKIVNSQLLVKVKCLESLRGAEDGCRKSTSECHGPQVQMRENGLAEANVECESKLERYLQKEEMKARLNGSRRSCKRFGSDTLI